MNSAKRRLQNRPYERILDNLVPESCFCALKGGKVGSTEKDRDFLDRFVIPAKGRQPSEPML